MKPEELGSEVNRLYWETDVPVTRLAEQLDVSRGTFYNHLRPLRAAGKCPSCKGSLEFRKRSDRENGIAHCSSCGREQPATAAAAGRTGTASAASGQRTARGQARTATGAHAREASLLAARSAFLAGSDSDDDRLRTQLVIVAVGAAILGLGILYISRRRS